jgi:hypothetical protein
MTPAPKGSPKTPPPAGPEPFEHPKLTPKQDRLQRGGNPPARGADAGAPARRILLGTPFRPAGVPMSPTHVPQTFRQDLLLPYLLVRAFPGDHGIRPVKNVNVAAQSPDILVVAGDVKTPDAQDPGLIPRFGRPHTVFVRVWNLGLLSALGVTLSVFETHMTGKLGNFQWTPPKLVGRRLLDLPDCHDPACRALFRLDQPWMPAVAAMFALRNAKLIATVGCFADPGPERAVPEDEEKDRHVGARGFMTRTPDDFGLEPFTH